MQGGEGRFYGADRYKYFSFGPQDDPMAIVNTITAPPNKRQKMDEDINSEEIPENLQNEIKKPGAITVSLSDVKIVLEKIGNNGVLL